MKSFANLASFSAFLLERARATQEAHGAALEAAAVIIEKEAKAEIGHYQNAAGPFDAWAELADSTKADRVAKGFPANNPLLRSGELLHSISHSVEGDHAVVGSDSDIAVYQEMGSSRIPPRSFLGGAAVRKGEDAANAAGLVMARVVAGKPVR